MKNKLISYVKRICVATLAATVLISAVPVQASLVTDDSNDEDIVDESELGFYEEGNLDEFDVDSYIYGTEEAEESLTTESAYVSRTWPEQTITGSDQPTLQALTPEEFSEVYDAGEEVNDNIYTLTVSTGINGCPDGVRYIVVKYTDIDGDMQSKYILMSDNPLMASYDYIGQKGGVNPEMDDRHAYLPLLNYKIDEPSAPTALEAWSVDEFLFKTEKEIKSIDDIHVFMRGGSTWSVQGINVSKVMKIGGFGEYGFYSGKYFFGITKKLITRMKSAKGTTLTLAPPKGADQRYKLAGGSNAYFTMEQVEDAEETSSPFNDIFTIRMDFADILEGGIESYLDMSAVAGKHAPSNFCEQIALELEYKDVNGWTQNVILPVMLSAYGQYFASGDRVNTIGLGQRGETVAFTGYLPGYASMVSSRLYIGKAARDKLNAQGVKTINNSMEASLDNDVIALAGLSIYKGTCRISNTEDGVDAATNEMLKSYTTAYSFSESMPLYYYTNTDKGGVLLTPNTTHKIKLKTYTKGNPIVASKATADVLVRVLTSDTSGKSGTSGNVQVRLDYRDDNGKTRKTGLLDVKSLSNDYLGYWPSSEGKNSNFAYDYGMKPGNYVEFWAELPGITSVSSADVTLSETDDEYILGGISVLVAEKFGRRRIYRQDLTGNTATSKFKIVRDSVSAELDGFPLILSEPRLFSAGEAYNYSVGGSDGGGIRFIDTDIYPELRYSMSYAQTKQNLGFAKTRMTYEVGVKVADNADGINSEGDAGSVNKFYFQLQFKNGNSGFVMANQQISSDGFRAGYTEIFNISVNHNYGDLKSIRIIPEDTQSDNDVFDKLNIEYITVTENNGGGAAKQYVIDRVGWIGIDYHDEAEAASIRGRGGRKAGELASRFTVSYQRKVVNLLCEITSLPSDIQPEASVACELTYVDTNGTPQTICFDVIRRMADYMKKTAKSYEAPTSGASASFYQNMTTISDPTWMLRPGHTDRFILPAIVNLKSVKSMKFVAVNRGSGTAIWEVGGIYISEVIADGPLTITADDEYYRNMSTTPLCQKVSAKEKDTFVLTAGTAQSLDVILSENELVYTDDSSWATPVTRLPEGAGDTLDVYVYPSDNSRNIKDVDITIAAQYTTAFSGAMQASDSGLDKYGTGTEEAMFYSKGLNVDGMERLISLGIRCVSTRIAFDHAIVQHVRDGVVVADYYIPLLGASAKVGLTGKPDRINDRLADNKVQQMNISFAETTEDYSLIEVDRDIAVSFKYRSTLDHGTSEYYSPYVYLTDADYKKIRAGLMAEVTFEIPFVAEITGYRIGAFGDITADISGAQIATYGYENRAYDETTGISTYENMIPEAVYCFNQQFSLTNAIENYDVTGIGFEEDDTLNLIDLTFKTQDALSSHESGTTDPVEMVFYYLDSMGALKSKQFTDIRPFIQGDDRRFNTGSLSEIKLFLPECKDLVAILIIPNNGTGLATWSVESVSGSMSLGEKALNRAVNKQFTELTKEAIIFMEGYDLPDVSSTGNGESLNNNALQITTFDYGEAEGRRTAGTVEDHKASIEIRQTDTVRIYPAFEGGGDYRAVAMGLKTYTDTVTDALKTGFVEVNCISDLNGVLTFTPLSPDEVSVYKIVITSTRDSSLVDIIDITVAGEAETPALEEDVMSSSERADNSGENSAPVNDGGEEVQN